MIDRKIAGIGVCQPGIELARSSEEVAWERVGASGTAPRRLAGQVLAWVGFGPPEAPWGRTRAAVSLNVRTSAHGSWNADLFPMNLHRRKLSNYFRLWANSLVKP